VLVIVIAHNLLSTIKKALVCNGGMLIKKNIETGMAISFGIYFTTKTGHGAFTTTPDAVLPSIKRNSDTLLIPITMRSIFF
jgi:hypothetical protein